jgi:excisionase family DNA binding protein
LQEIKLLIDKKSAAQSLSISVRTLDYFIARGELSVRRVGRRCLIERRELERFARSDHKSPTPEREGVDEYATTKRVKRDGAAGIDV